MVLLGILYSLVRSPRRAMQALKLCLRSWTVVTLAFEHFIEAFETIVFEQLRPSPL